eukprot:366362-Chlamydomonas_euryale.AAC.4
MGRPGCGSAYGLLQTLSLRRPVASGYLCACKGAACILSSMPQTLSSLRPVASRPCPEVLPIASAACPTLSPDPPTDRCGILTMGAPASMQPGVAGLVGRWGRARTQHALWPLSDQTWLGQQACWPWARPRGGNMQHGIDR